MHNFQRLLTGLAVEPLLDALRARPELWWMRTERQTAPGSPHHDTEAIWLRGPREISLWSVFNDLASFDYPEMAAVIEPLHALMGDVLRQVGSRNLGRVMLVRLAPGGVIDPHEDQGRYAKAFSRFHLVLQADRGNEFECDGETVNMEPGELWWFNHRGQHAVRNGSDSWRIHLIFDCQTPRFDVRPLSSVVANKTAGMRIVEQPLVGMAHELQGLFEAHWQEIALNKQVMVLKPDLERYAQAEEAGALMCLAVVDPDGEVVGYSVNFIGPHLHYADLVVCNNDLLFLREDLRASRIGLRLIQQTEQIAAERGAQLMLWHAKEGTALAKLMPRMGYGVQDIIFSKEIGG